MDSKGLRAHKNEQKNKTTTEALRHSNIGRNLGRVTLYED